MSGYGDEADYGDLNYKGETTEDAFTPNAINPDEGVCLRLAIKEEQGRGWCRYRNDTTPNAMVWPEPRINGVQVFLADNQPVQLMLDEVTGLWFEISTRQGPAGSAISKTYLDKDVSGVGTEIPTELLQRVHEASSKRNRLHHQETHYHVDPDDLDNRGAAGHDADGLRNAFKATLEIFKDLEQVTPFASASNANSKNRSDLVVDKKTEAAQIQTKFKTTTSSFRLTNAEHLYQEENRKGTINERVLEHHTFQREFSDVLLWMTRGGNLSLNRTTGAASTGAFSSSSTGPDGVADSAMTFDGTDTLTNSVASVSGDFSTSFAFSGSVTAVVYNIVTGDLKIRVKVTGPVFEIEYDDAGVIVSKVLTYSGTGFVNIGINRSGTTVEFFEDGVSLGTDTVVANTFSGVVDIMPTEVGTIFDLRIMDDKITSGGYGYYDTDLDNNTGNSLIPNF